MTALIILTGNNTELKETYVSKHIGYKKCVYIKSSESVYNSIPDIETALKNNKIVLTDLDSYPNKEKRKFREYFLDNYPDVKLNCIVFGYDKKLKYKPKIEDGYTNIRIYKE